jgi:hypothetical protein
VGTVVAGTSAVAVVVTGIVKKWEVVAEVGMTLMAVLVGIVVAGAVVVVVEIVAVGGAVVVVAFGIFSGTVIVGVALVLIINILYSLHSFLYLK